MLPYILLLGVPSLPAMAGIRRSLTLILPIALLYIFMIGLRFKIGVDWNNYLGIYQVASLRPLEELIFSPEPAFAALMWVAKQTGGGFILVNVASAIIFCWGCFTFASRCREPMIAIIIATPLLVIGMAMSGIRQGIAIGIICHLFANWDKRSLIAKTAWVGAATLFHFSAIFMMIFVVLSSRASSFAKTYGILIALAGLLLVIAYAPTRFDFYADAYVTHSEVNYAGGGIYRLALLAVPAFLYFAVRRRWREVNGTTPLMEWIAIASVASIPALLISTVAVDRFALYFWPFAMYFWAGYPALIGNPLGRSLYRIIVIGVSFAIMISWLLAGYHQWAFLPYRNYLWAPQGESFYRPVHR